MPIQIGARRESDFTDPIGLLGDCHRRIEMFLNVMVRVTGQARGAALTDEQRGAFENALRYFREAAPKHTADEEESLFPRLRQSESAEVREVLARVDALEADHVRAGAIHAEVDELGMTWLRTGSLDEAQAGQLGALVAELQGIYSGHIAIEDGEIFPMAKAALSASERSGIGREMAARRGSTG